MEYTGLRKVDRVQTGVRVEKRLLKLLKSLAAYQEISVSDLLEGMILHNIDGKIPFGPDTLAFINVLRQSYGLDLKAEDSHRLIENDDGKD